MIKQFALRLLPAALQWHLKRWYYPRSLRNYTDDRWPEATFVRKLVRPGSQVVDAGANVGYISVLLSRIVGPNGIVHSFEPVPETCALLQNNLSRLDIQNVRVRQMGISDTAGRSQMITPNYKDGRKNLYQSKLIGAPTRDSFEVQLTRIDDALGEDVESIAFAKIDIEGHELKAIRGATRLIKSKPAMLIEVSGDPDAIGTNAADVFDLLKSSGLDSYRLIGQSLSRRMLGEKSVDYFFLSKEHMKKIGQ